MVERKYDKKKLTVLRIALIVFGAAIGFTALWQYFIFYPDVVMQEYKIVITVVSAAVFAALLGLSAKPCYNLFGGVVDGICSAAEKLGARGVIAVALGLAAAGIVVFVFDIVIRTVQDIWAVRLLTDVLVFMVFAAVCCIGFTKWLDAEEDNVKITFRKRGYLLSADCFTDARVLTAADVLIGAKVLDGAYKALLISGGDKEAADRLDALISSGKIDVVKCGKEFSRAEEYAEIERNYAANKRLKLVALNGNADVSLCSFSVLPSDITA